MKIAIVGTAGRGSDAAKMSPAIFNKMAQYAKQCISKLSPEHSKVILVSGGSAWADHVAVKLFLESLLEEDGSTNVPRIGGLELHLPCAFDDGSSGNPEYDRKSFVGNRLNTLHHSFDRKMMTSEKRFNSLNDIRTAILLGAVIKVRNGFHARNTTIARSAVDGLIAFTWRNDLSTPKQGGTYDTWKKSTSSCKIHVPLSWLEHATDASMGEVLEKVTGLKRKHVTIQSCFQQREAADEQVGSSITPTKTTRTPDELSATEYGNKRRRI